MRRRASASPTPRLRSSLLARLPPRSSLGSFLAARSSRSSLLVASLLAQQHEPATRAAAAAAFEALLTTNGVSASLNRPNRARFRQNLEALLQYVEAYLEIGFPFLFQFALALVGALEKPLLALNATDVKLWWPNGYGGQAMYELGVSFAPHGSGSAAAAEAAATVSTTRR